MSNRNNSRDSYICRQHFGVADPRFVGPYFKYQKYMLKLEAILFRKLGYTTRQIKTIDDYLNVKKYSFITRLMAKWQTLDKIPFVYAKKVKCDKEYLRFEQFPYLDIQVKYDSRPSIVTIPGASIISKQKIKKNEIFRYGLNLLENTDPLVLNAVLRVNIEINGGNKKKKINYSFTLDPWGHPYESYFEAGTNWIDAYVDLSEFENQEVDFSLTANFEKNRKKIFPAAVPCVAWSTPQVVKKKTNNFKRILFLCCEALTEPKFLQEYHGVKINTPCMDALSEESTVYTRAYSQNETTLPSMGTLFTGLFASQHGIFDYKSNPYKYEIPTISPNVKTLSELIKAEKFINIGSMTETRTNPVYGWVRGFDSFSYIDTSWSEHIPDEKWVKYALESLKGLDGMLSVHLDLLHWRPTIKFGHNLSPWLYSSDLLEETSRDEQTLNLYIERMTQLDRQMEEIIHYLKKTDQYENTLILLTGDHGAFLLPWGFGERYPFYERRIRTPLIIKWPKWAERETGEIKKPHMASLCITDTVLSSLKISKPDYFYNLPQHDAAFKDIAITETVTHPKRDDYAISLISDPYKYVLFLKVNWKEYSIKEIEGERLYPINMDTGHVNEDSDIALENKKVTEKMRAMALKFLERNMKFQQQFPPKSFRTGEVDWEPKSHIIKKGLSKIKETFF